MTIAPHSITASEIVWTLTPTPTWPAFDDILQAAVALLPGLEDDVAADLIEMLVVALVDAREQVEALTLNTSLLLGLANTKGSEARRLRQRLHDVLDAQRKGVA
jgi:hypothetical protein